MAGERDIARLRRLVALFDEAAPEDATLRDELSAVGADPVLVRARARSFVRDLARRRQGPLGDGLAGPYREVDLVSAEAQPLPLPWVVAHGEQWRTELAVASHGRDERSWIGLDFSRTGMAGGVRVGFFVHPGDPGPGALSVEWDADFFHAPGWRLSLFRGSEAVPFFVRNLGNGYRGSAILTADMLGVDPLTTPMRFSFDPDG